jgi:hypothetical protein
MTIECDKDIATFPFAALAGARAFFFNASSGSCERCARAAANDPHALHAAVPSGKLNSEDWLVAEGLGARGLSERVNLRLLQWAQQFPDERAVQKPQA